MSKTSKILAVCLVIAVISATVGVISAVMNPEAVSMFVAAGPGLMVVVLLIALMSAKKDGSN
ncbi:MAG: hypothetical protein FWG91_00805 [Lachnospiraceae bacterium]|nr:hypothetical protein [Lachnospiraceae bacterium]